MFPPFPPPFPLQCLSQLETVIHECSTRFVQSILFYVSGQIVNRCLQGLVGSAEVSIFLMEKRISQYMKLCPAIIFSLFSFFVYILPYLLLNL